LDVLPNTGVDCAVVVLPNIVGVLDVELFKVIPKGLLAWVESVVPVKPNIGFDVCCVELVVPPPNVIGLFALEEIFPNILLLCVVPLVDETAPFCNAGELPNAVG